MHMWIIFQHLNKMVPWCNPPAECHSKCSCRAWTDLFVKGGTMLTLTEVWVNTLAYLCVNTLAGI